MSLFDNRGKGSEAEEQIVNLLLNNKFPHSVIIECEDKEKAAGIVEDICKFLFCVDNKDKPCGVCSACNKVCLNSHPDICSISGTGALRSIHIDDIRKIREDSYILPNEAKSKVYIINDADQMSVQAQNAFLKVLEEPPENVIFILVCKSSLTILDTIKSRCQRFLLNSCELGTSDEGVIELTRKIVGSIISSDKFELLSLTSNFVKNKNMFVSVIDELGIVIKESISVSFNAGVDLKYPDEAQKLSMNLTKSNLLHLGEKINKIKLMLEQNANYNLLLTAFCIDIRKYA